MLHFVNTHSDRIARSYAKSVQLLDFLSWKIVIVFHIINCDMRYLHGNFTRFLLRSVL